MRAVVAWIYSATGKVLTLKQCGETQAGGVFSFRRLGQSGMGYGHCRKKGTKQAIIRFMEPNLSANSGPLT